MRIVYFFMILLFLSCKQEKTILTVQQVIDKSIEFSGLNRLKSSEISFQFRDKYYVAKRNNGTFELSRSFKKDSKNIKDILTNSGFKRFVNDSLIPLSIKQINSYSNAVNSAHYFSVLPFGLNDKAVHKKLLSSVKIKGVDYYKIRVTFSEENGGKDFDDVFIYWFQKDNFQLDYLAYKYHTNEGGVRFRDVKREQRINGIRFVDYTNYKPILIHSNFIKIDSFYKINQLKKVSEIVLEDVIVVLK